MLDDLIKELEKEIGKSDTNQEVSQWIDTGFPNLNKVISGKHDGGLGFGRLYEMFAGSSMGKTALATYIMINAQKMGGVAIFIDYERSFDVGMAVDMGLSIKSPFWIYKAPDTWEKGNTIAMQAAEIIRKSGAISKDAPIFIVQDSIASAVPKSTFEKGGIDELNMNDSTALSRVTSSTLKSVQAHCNKTNATVLYLNQIRSKIGVMYGSPITTPGGAAMEFYASARIQLTRSMIMEGKKDEQELIGQHITAKVVKSKHTRPFQKAELLMGFSMDGSAYFDHVVVLIDYLIKIGVIPTAGAYIEWDGKKYHRNPFYLKAKEEDLYETLKALIPADLP